LQLTRRRDWWDSQRLTQSWANRYPLSPREGEAAVTVGAVDEFLNISEKHAAAEEERAKRLRQRLQFTGAAAAVAMTLASGAFAWGEAQNAETQSRLRRAAAERAEQTYWFGKQQGVLREAAQREAVRARNAEMAAKRNAQNAAISAKNEAAAALRATRLAKEAQSSAALATASSAAMLATIESNLSDLASAREEVQRPASSTREQAESLGRQLDPRAVRRPTQSASQLGAMAALLAGEAAAGEVGTSKPPAKTAEYMSMQADSVLSAVRDVPAMTARAAILQGRAAELRGSAEDFRTAAAAYETALDSSAGDGGIQAQLAALEASTALIRLHRRLGITPRQEQAARQCLEASLPPSPSPAFVPLLECRLAVAELRLSQGDRKAAETLLDDISANAAPSVSGPDGTPLTLPETSLPRLKLRILSRYLWGEATQMASTTDVRDETLVEQAKRYSEMNPETEEASSLYALALEAFNQDLESAFAIRRPLLENSETSTGYLMDSVPLLQRFESEQPAQSLESLGEDNSAIRSTIESLRRSGGLMQVLRTLDARHAPDPRLPGQSDHDSHSALLRAAEDRAAKRAADIDAMFRSAGERNDLLTDLRLYPDAYLSPEDRSQIQSLMDLLDLYEAACSPGTGHSDCQQNVRGVEHVLAPIQERWQPTRRRGGLKFGVEVSESDLPWFNGYDVVAYNLAGRPIRGNARFAVDLGGRKLLFSSQENLEQYTRASLPEYGGAAVEWVKVGEVKPGNPRYFCPIEGRVFLFYSLNTRDRWCRLGKGSARDTLINGVDMAWRDLGREAVPAMPEVTFADPISGTAVKSPSRVVYPLTSTTVVRSPAAGVVFTFRDGMIRIGHADGSYSLLAIQGGRFQIGAGTWLRKGETIPTSLDATVETGKLIWDLKIPSAEIE
jgi:hypothetical protein